jgi:hypothetical protein
LLEGAFDPAVHDRADLDPTPEYLAVNSEALLRVKAVIERWDNINIRTVLLLYLEAAWEGEPVTYADIAQQAATILDQELSESSIRKWKQRGIKKLYAELGLNTEDGAV